MIKDFQPKLFKYQKYHNHMILDKLKKKEFKHFKLVLGKIGIKALISTKINGIQISACLKTITRECKRQHKIWIYCFPNISLTAKSISVRMGKGIGGIIDWIYIIRKNNIFIEVFGQYKSKVIKGLKNCKKKIPFPTKIIIGDYLKKWKNFKYFI